MSLIGKTLGQYKIQAPIGKGGMAEVYSATQESLGGRLVAVKIMKSELVTDQEFINRFNREVKLLVDLQHPHIVPVFDGGEQDGIVYLVMRLIEGGGLHRRLNLEPLELPKVAKILAHIGSALSYAHKKAGIVHRDMKPSNVLLDDQDNAYLTDFGIAKILAGTTKLTATNSVMGTPAYMAPEQWRGQDLDGRADIYSMGIMAFEMVTGRLPYEGDTTFSLMYMHLNELPPNPRELMSSLPVGLDTLILRAIAKDRTDRFASAEDFGNAFRAAVEGRAVTIEPLPASATPAKGNTEITVDKSAWRESPNTFSGESALPSSTPTPPMVITNPMQTPPPILMTQPVQGQNHVWTFLGMAVVALIIAAGLIGFLLANQNKEETGEATLPPATPTQVSSQPQPGQAMGPVDVTLDDYHIKTVIPGEWAKPLKEAEYYRIIGPDGQSPDMTVLRGKPGALLTSGLFNRSDDLFDIHFDPRVTLENIARAERFEIGYTIAEVPGAAYRGYYLSGISGTKNAAQADYWIFELVEGRARESEWLVILSRHPQGEIYPEYRSRALNGFLLRMEIDGKMLLGAPVGSPPEGGQPDNPNQAPPDQGQPPNQSPPNSPDQGPPPTQAPNRQPSPLPTGT